MLSNHVRSLLQQANQNLREAKLIPKLTILPRHRTLQNVMETAWPSETDMHELVTSPGSKRHRPILHPCRRPSEEPS